MQSGASSITLEKVLMSKCGNAAKDNMQAVLPHDYNITVLTMRLLEVFSGVSDRDACQCFMIRNKVRACEMYHSTGGLGLVLLFSAFTKAFTSAK